MDRTPDDFAIHGSRPLPSHLAAGYQGSADRAPVPVLGSFEQRMRDSRRARRRAELFAAARVIGGVLILVTIIGIAAAVIYQAGYEHGLLAARRQ